MVFFGCVVDIGPPGANAPRRNIVAVLHLSLSPGVFAYPKVDV